MAGGVACGSVCARCRSHECRGQASAVPQAPDALETMQILIRLPWAGSALIGGALWAASGPAVVAASQWNVIDHGLSR